MERVAIAAAMAAACAALPSSAAAETAQTQSEPEKPLPAEQFAALPFLSGPELSPDGERLAAKVSVKGRQMLAIFSLFEQGALELVAAGESDLNWWKWVNDDWLVVGLGALQGLFGDNWYISRMAGISRDGKTMKPIAFRDAAQNAGNLMWVAQDGSPRILLSRQTSVYSSDPGFWPEVLEADVSTGKSKVIVKSRSNITYWYADGAGTVRMGLGYDPLALRTWLVYRENAGDSFRTIDRASQRKDEDLLSPQLFLPDPGKAIISDRDNGFDALYDFDLTTMTRGRKLFSVPDHDLDYIIANRTGDGLAGIAYTDTRSRIQWVDADLAKIQADLDKAVGADRTARIVSFNRDQTRMLVLVGGADRAGAYYYFDIASGKMVFIANNSPGLKNAALNPVKTVRYAARDGLGMSAVLTLPRRRQPTRLPVIVMPHGGPAARDEEGWDWWAQFMAERGYAVIQPNYRGSSGFGAAFSDKGDGEWGLKMQDDLNDALDFLAREGIGDRTRACMVGGSYGGYAALRAAQRDGKLYRCAVSFAGVSDLRHLAISDARSLYGRSWRHRLRERAPDFAAVSPLNFPEQFGAPVLLVHGAKDLRVPVEQSRRMAEKLKQAGKAVRYVEQPLGDHHFSRADDRLQFLKELEAFLAEHNPA